MSKPPLIRGGQGRTDNEVSQSVEEWCICLAIVFVAVAGFVLGRVL